MNSSFYKHPIPILALLHFCLVLVQSVGATDIGEVADSTAHKEQDSVPKQIKIIGLYSNEYTQPNSTHRHVSTYLSILENGNYSSDYVLNHAFSFPFSGKWERKKSRLVLYPDHHELPKRVYKIQTKNDSIYLNAIRIHIGLVRQSDKADYKGGKVEMVPIKPVEAPLDTSKVSIPTLDRKEIKKIIDQYVFKSIT